MSSLDFVLERTVTIAARRETVFRYFTDSDRFAAWWGEGSRIEPRPGGTVHVRHPNGVVASGEVVEIRAPERIVFTYGYASGAPLPAGGSRVTITLEETSRGTRLHLRHELPTAAARDEHVQGWRYQLALFANVVAREVCVGIDALADSLLAALSEPDRARRERDLRAIAGVELAFHDAFSCTDGVADLAVHIDAVQRHMPGLRLTRRGGVRQCQGTAVVEWVAAGPDGATRGQGTSVLELDPDGRIARVTALWGPAPQ